MTPTTFLRPVHAWFFAWENVVPPVYRVVAVAIASGVTAVILAALGADLLLAAVLSLAAWVALAIAQEHDERVLLAPDPRFVEALEAEAGRAPLFLRFEHATGPSRARRESFDCFLLSTDAGEDHPLSGRLVQIERSVGERAMCLDVFDDATCDSFEPILARLRTLGEVGLADRVQRAEATAADVETIVTALRVAYW